MEFVVGQGVRLAAGASNVLERYVNRGEIYLVVSAGDFLGDQTVELGRNGRTNLFYSRDFQPADIIDPPEIDEVVVKDGVIV